MCKKSAFYLFISTKQKTLQYTNKAEKRKQSQAKFSSQHQHVPHMVKALEHNRTHPLIIAFLTRGQKSVILGYRFFTSENLDNLEQYEKRLFKANCKFSNCSDMML